MLTEAQVEQFRRMGRPEIWTVEGTKNLGKLIRQSRAKLSHPLRYRKGVTAAELADYINKIMAIRGTPFTISGKTIEGIESPDPKTPRHNTFAAIAAAEFILHPVTNEVLSPTQLSQILSELYNPFVDEKNHAFIGVADLTKSATLLSGVIRESLMSNSAPKGVRNLAAVLKTARLDRGISIPDLCNRVRETTGIEINPETLRQIESGAGEIGADVLMALAAYEYAINPNTARPYSIQDILNILNERLEPLNPRTNRQFTEADFEFLEILCNCEQHHPI